MMRKIVVDSLCVPYTPIVKTEAKMMIQGRKIDDYGEGRQFI